MGGCGRLGALQMWALRTELRYIFARLLRMDVKRTSPGLSVAQGPRMGKCQACKRRLASGRFLPSQSALPLLKAVRALVLVAVYASSSLRWFASVLQAASAIISREFLTKTRQTGAAERQATLGDTQSTDALPRITAAPKPLPPTPAPNQPAAQPQSERAEPTPRAYARQPSARRATLDSHLRKKEKRR